jgi:hypothetical protein
MMAANAGRAHDALGNSSLAGCPPSAGLVTNWNQAVALEALRELRCELCDPSVDAQTASALTEHWETATPTTLAVANTSSRSSDCLKKIWFDGLVHDKIALRHLSSRVSVSQVDVETNDPLDIGRYNIHEPVDATPCLTDVEGTAVLSGNASRLINLH